MSEKEKKIVEKLKRAIPNMSDFDKGYILGKTEKMAEESVKKQGEENAKPIWERTSQNLKEHWRYSEKNWEVHEWWWETAYDHLQCSFSCNERRTWMKKWTYRQKRDLLDKLEPWITALVQFISALAGAAVGIAICYFF